MMEPYVLIEFVHVLPAIKNRTLGILTSLLVVLIVSLMVTKPNPFA